MNYSCLLNPLRSFHIWHQNEAILFVTCILKTQHIFDPCIFFKLKRKLKLEFVGKLSRESQIMTIFVSTLCDQNWHTYGNLKTWPIFTSWPSFYFWPKNYRVLSYTRLHMWTKCGDDWSKTATCIAFQTNRDKQTDRQTYNQTNILRNFGK